ncbi:protein MAIN-LIKE 2-like [Cryptomeria japonica]|uniref:protein MAIN-LIKE 2-like n=1 Tax=Cryptomeria japonica TaxID=3369 RepID=UPI0027DA2797|nr:protein MAIN-LIKE 2-like [Cryptomeria japonica]
MNGLYDVMHMLMIRMNHRLITALAERWHSETCTFHLVQGEITVTLEDVWRILRILIQGELVIYDRYWGTLAVQRFFDEGVFIDDGSISWEEIATLYEPLPAVLSGIVGGLLCPDRCSHGLAIRWEQVIEQMITEGTQFAWGPCVLAHLYQELHEVVYRGRGS